jgi:hypothetical protein
MSFKIYLHIIFKKFPFFQTVRLIESIPIEVDKINLKRASAMAKKHNNPGYSLCLKLIPLLFSDEELALSRGQGLAKAKPGDLRPKLSKEKIAVMKGRQTIIYR